MEILQYDDFRTEKIAALINTRSTFEIGVSPEIWAVPFEFLRQR